MGAIRRAHLDQLDARALHDLGDAKRASNLDQFTPGNHHLSTLGERVERQHQGGGVVIAYIGGLGPGQEPEPLGGPGQPVTAPPVFDVEFEIRVTVGRSGRGFGGSGRHRGTPQIRMEHDPGGVNDRLGPRPGDLLGQPEGLIEPNLIPPGVILPCLFAPGGGVEDPPSLRHNPLSRLRRRPARNFRISFEQRLGEPMN